MSTNSIKKTAETLAKLGIILSDENSLRRLHELRSQRNQLSSYLTKTERYKGKVSPITYEKVKEDYQKRLQEVLAELEEKEKKLKGEFDLMLQKRDELVEIIRPLALEFEELKFRCIVGEYTKAAFLSLASDKIGVLKDQKEKLVALLERLSFYRLILNLQEESVEPTESLPLELDDFEMPKEESETPSFQPAEDESAVTQETTLVSMEEEEFEFNFDTIQTGVSENEVDETELSVTEADIDLERMTESEQAFLILKEEGQDDKPFFITAEEPITIGRAKDNALRIDENTISRYHAKVSFESGQYVIRDLGSSNGTFVNGKKVSEQILADDDLVVLGGKVKFIFKKL